MALCGAVADSIKRASGGSLADQLKALPDAINQPINQSLPGMHSHFTVALQES